MHRRLQVTDRLAESAAVIARCSKSASAVPGTPPINVCVTAAGHGGQRQPTDPPSPSAARQPVETAGERYQRPRAELVIAVQIFEHAVIAAAISPGRYADGEKAKGILTLTTQSQTIWSAAL